MVFTHKLHKDLVETASACSQDASASITGHGVFGSMKVRYRCNYVVASVYIIIMVFGPRNVLVILWL